MTDEKFTLSEFIADLKSFYESPYGEKGGKEWECKGWDCPYNVKDFLDYYQHSKGLEVSDLDCCRDCGEKYPLPFGQDNHNCKGD